ncbi:hypothetical protein Ga0061061_111102 [Chelatococcus sambhunathii]|uniref:HTH cro/C1-type domain-containing protein n=2 Tax=Chelatococcus sambhunathii TaxID=363953 RepID=A0ABP2A7R0_9HYPH|nr:hypothetical protein Ga0061061_111102 [Chelatococcus sambhunathii]
MMAKLMFHGDAEHSRIFPTTSIGNIPLAVEDGKSDKSDMDDSTFRNRIADRLAEIGRNPFEAARRGGLERSFIVDILTAKKKSVRGQNLAKLAKALDTTVEHLLGEPPVKSSGKPSLALTNAPLVEVKVAGIVEAGAFREAPWFSDEDEPATVATTRDRDFPEVQLVAFDVGGDSMNALKPRPILPGDRVICLDFEDLRGRLPLRDGMVVVVEQTLDGGHHREWSVKQIELYEDRTEFHPRSTNKAHKPIVVPRVLARDPSEEDNRQVKILAIVRRIENEVPLF